MSVDPNVGAKIPQPSPAGIIRVIGQGIYTSIRSRDPGKREAQLLRDAGWTISNTGPRGSPIYRDPAGRRVTGNEAADAGRRLRRASAEFEAASRAERGVTTADRIRGQAGRAGRAARAQLPRVGRVLQRIPRVGAVGGLITGIFADDLIERALPRPAPAPPAPPPSSAADEELLRRIREQQAITDTQVEQLEAELAAERKRAAAPPRQPRPAAPPQPGPVSPVLTPVAIYTSRLPLPTSTPAPTAGPGTPAAPTPSLGAVLSRYGMLGLPLLLSALTTPQRQPGRRRRRDPLTPAVPGLTDDQGTLRDLLTPGLTEAMYPFPGASFSGGGGPVPGTGLCECPKPRKKSRKKSRSVCYSGRYTEGRRGLRKTKQRKVPCR